MSETHQLIMNRALCADELAAESGHERNSNEKSSPYQEVLLASADRVRFGFGAFGVQEYGRAAKEV